MASVNGRFWLVFMVIGTFFCVILFSGSGSEKKRINALATQIEQQLITLKKHLDMSSPKLKYVAMVRQYADVVMQENPQMQPLATQLKQDSFSSGQRYQRLSERFVQLMDNTQSLNQDEKLAELALLATASNPSVFDDSLVDMVNTLAGLSSSLPAVAQAQQVLPGEQLVGNPQYGQWQTDSQGRSFWEWYGMYRLFGDVVGAIFYHDAWSRNRPWSFHHDYGSGLYSSHRERKKHTQVIQDNRRNRYQNNQRFVSSYGRRTNNRFQPSYQTKTTMAASQGMRQSFQRSRNRSSHRSGIRSSSRFGGK